MPRLVTDAIVLHVFDYSETSRILRLATREAGVQSAIARGARRARSRFGTALDLFAGGVAELHMKAGRELQTLASFDVVSARPGLATGCARFVGASALGELVLRFGTEEGGRELYGTFERALDSLHDAGDPEALEAALAGAWSLVSALGFAPSLRRCCSCHEPLGDDSDLAFSHTAGGALCARCGGGRASRRPLPAAARMAIARWCEGDRAAPPGSAEARAHQRLLRQFLQHHLTDGRPLRAFDAWERGWGPA